jgi:hypothetical protein
MDMPDSVSSSGRGARAALACALVLGAWACTTARSSEPAGMSQAQPFRTEAVRAWQVIDLTGLRGIVVQFTDRDQPDQPGRQFFSVRNPLQQELGSIDALGRAWRFVPHEREAHWVGTGTLLEGARRILGASDGATLVEISLSDLRGAPRG